jgi:hypothetical protein
VWILSVIGRQSKVLYLSVGAKAEIALLWGITQHRMVNIYPYIAPETSVKVYHSTLRSTPEEAISDHHRGGCLKPGAKAVWHTGP